MIHQVLPLHTTKLFRVDFEEISEKQSEAKQLFKLKMPTIQAQIQLPGIYMADVFRYHVYCNLLTDRIIIKIMTGSVYGNPKKLFYF